MLKLVKDVLTKQLWPVLNRFIIQDYCMGPYMLGSSKDQKPRVDFSVPFMHHDGYNILLIVLLLLYVCIILNRKALSAFKRLARLDQDYYPERMGKVCWY